ncbi:M42 family metallopeptidase [Haloplasma contractile]|uniref:Cellulase M protein n=1 Tax=Haloplasma contractile SSD-17B TaxID=1033810 RepID=U2DYB7_9MOLU|nr:M42 family metallopeptidase [Haloplasma contractile]ERJ13252.1 Cellulase M protein [Haloplasma contractile SSD-17B]
MEETLKELIERSGPSGFEHDVVRYLVDRVKDLADDYWVDGIGNVIVVKEGKKPGPSLVVSAHMDEVGFIVKKIEGNGLIRFENLGGHDDRVLLAQRVKIRTNKGIQYGVIGTISAHMKKFDDVSKIRKYSSLYIDVGVSSKEEVKELGINVGDPITWATDYQVFGKNRVIGKGFDDRAGCAVLLKTLEEINFNEVSGTVYGVFSTQEEVGLRGAKVAGQQLNADVAIAVDTTAVSDTFEEMMDQTLFIGEGPGIKVMDSSLIASVAVRNKLIKIAKEHNIPYQLEIFTGIGTDSGSLHQAKAGVPSGVISIPSRYAHSPVEVIDLEDLKNSKELLKQFILALKDKDDFSFI